MTSNKKNHARASVGHSVCDWRQVAPASQALWVNAIERSHAWLPPYGPVRSTPGSMGSLFLSERS